MFAWELGGGLGHLIQMQPLAEDLVAQGHRVYVALRNLSGAAAVFGRSGVSFLQAPSKVCSGPPLFRRTDNFAQILANVGWADYGELFAIACGWRNLFRLTRPDLILFDHSPTALLASRGLPARRAVIGSGFCVPPDACPFPPYSLNAAAADLDKLLASEQALLRRANRLLAQWRQPPMERLGQLYGEADQTFLLTFPELDHHTDRPAGGRYWGPVNGTGGKPPQWPEANGRRVYAYLKRFPALSDLLAALRDRGNPTLVYADGITPATRARFECATLRFETERLDLARVGRECDLAILNANHGTTSTMLMAGKPILQLPLVLEQQLMAAAVRRIGAGEVAPVKEGSAERIGQKLDLLLTDDRCGRAAAQFAARHADFNPRQQRRDMLRRCGELLAAAAEPLATVGA
jgi:hypothetical protein